MGIPVAEGLYGDQGIFYYMMFLIPVRIIYYILMPFVLAPGENGKVDFRSIAKVFTSVPMISLYLAVILYVAQIKIPDFIGTPLKNLSTVVSTMGIALIGVSIADVDFKELFSKAENLLLPIFVDVAAPLAVLAVLAVLFGSSMPYEALAVAVIYSALPTATMVPIWTSKFYEGDEAAVSGASVGVVMSTLLSIVTLPIVAVVIEAVLL